MNTSDVARRVAEIAAVRADDERAHGMDLHQDVLKAIAEGRCAEPVECARLALTTLDIHFCRWCA